MKHSDFLEGDVAIVELGGRVMAGDDTTKIHGKVQYYLGLNKKHFVFDLNKVEWMSSAGLGALIASHASVAKAGGRMVLANVTNIEALLAMTRLITVFETFDDRKSAIASLSAHAHSGN